MKEFDENEAVKAMMDAIAPAQADENDVCEVLDLIFDYYEENGDLDIDADADEETDVEAIADFALRYLTKNGAPDVFTRDQIIAMVKAELTYEDSLL